MTFEEVMRNKVYDYIMSSTTRKENFADIEICCEEDNDEANNIVVDLLSKYSRDDLANFIINVIGGDCEICMGGYMDADGNVYPIFN